ncbi:glycosyltransferase [Salibacter sp.]|uniref:glycosyltransferase n=1 Tax=Salibacter sp. TaxID=2010995 RepID=UPI00287040D8|nr:glycosyltransferase [Salibacter sp.]
MTEKHLQLIFIVFIAFTVLQLLYTVFVQMRFIFRVKKEKKRDLPLRSEPVSVVIAARNEESNLRENLPAILSQNHPNYEVVVVNDRSNDDTALVLREFDRQVDHLKVCKIEDDKKGEWGKKYALTIGLKAAKNDRVVLTDADCKPASDLWLQRMSLGLTEKEIVLGVSPLLSNGGFWGRFMEVDALKIAFQYITLAMCGMPYMGVGRNIAYRKGLFFSKKGFSKHMHLSSGDDDLFVNEAANANNTAVVTHPDGFTFSKTARNLNQFINQKRRHVSTSPHYRINTKLTLLSLSFSQYIVFGLFVVLLITETHIQLALSLFFVRYLTEQVQWIACCSVIKMKKLAPYKIIYDMISPFVYGYIGAIELKNRSTAWKRRM